VSGIDLAEVVAKLEGPNRTASVIDAGCTDLSAIPAQWRLSGSSESMAALASRSTLASRSLKFPALASISTRGVWRLVPPRLFYEFLSAGAVQAAQPDLQVGVRVRFGSGLGGVFRDAEDRGVLVPAHSQKREP
jgi:hypothetical protein